MKPPAISRRQCVNALRRADFRIIRTSGDHFILRKDGRNVIVPDSRTIQRGTMKSILKQAGLTAAEFDLLRREK